MTDQTNVIPVEDAAKDALWSAAHPENEVDAEGSDNQGKYPSLDGSVYRLDVAVGTAWCVSALAFT